MATRVKLLRFGVMTVAVSPSSSSASPGPKDVRIDEDLRDLFRGLFTIEDDSASYQPSV